MTVIVMTNIIDRSSVMIVFLLVQQAVSFGGTNYFPTQTHSTLKQYVPPCFFHRYLMHGPRHTPIPLQVTMDSSPSTGFIEDAKEDNTNENNEDTSRDPIKPEQFHHSNSNGKRRPQRNNVAMGDTAFLRKRTTDLLRVTSGEFLSNTSDMESNHNNSLSRRMKVGRKTFNFLIDAWAFSGELDAADHALRLLERMEFLQDCSPDFISSAPDVRSYTKVINAISRSARPDAGDIAEEILNKMEYLYSSGANLSAKPNTFTYTTVIEAYANSGSEGSAEKAEAILDRMIARFQAGDTDVTPTARSFNAAITAYGKCGGSGAAQRAEEIFHRMDAIYMSGIEEAKPSTFNYNALITALANSGEEGSAQRAAEVLERMEQCYASGDLDCRPTTVSFNAVIDAYAKSGEEHSASRAEQVLRHMEDLYESGEEVRPNTRSFNSVLNAYAKSGEETGALKAQDLLDFMSSLYERGNEAVRPDVHSYCTVINGTNHFQALIWSCETFLLRINSLLLNVHFYSMGTQPTTWKSRTGQ